MPIEVFDGSEAREGALQGVVSTLSSEMSGQITNPDTIEGSLSRAIDSLDTSFSGQYTAPTGGSFDWTHGLGDLRVLASDVMGPRWGIGAAGTTIIDSSAELAAYETFRTFFSTIGDYVTYKIDPPADYTHDLFLDCRFFPSAALYGIHIGRWRHVILLAPHVSLLNQDLAWLQAYNPAATRGNGLFEAANKQYAGGPVYPFQPGLNLHQVDDPTGPNVYYNNPGSYTSLFDSERGPHKGWNIHPRMPGACMLRLEHSGYCFIEGARLNANGMQGDGIIMADNGLAATTNNANRRIYFVNGRIENYDGQSRHLNYGDGIHGDSLHSQGGNENSSYWENVVIRSGQEGNVHTGTIGPNFMQHHFSRNYQYELLPAATNFRNLNDYAPPGEKSPGAVISYKVIASTQFGERDVGGRYYVENLWCANKTSNVLKFTDTTYTTSHPLVNAGFSPINFAPANRVGVNYGNSSPSNDYYNSL